MDDLSLFFANLGRGTRHTNIDHRTIIRRVESNDQSLVELSIGSIPRCKDTSSQLVKALHGNTHIKRVTFRGDGYDFENLQSILDALSELNVTKITAGPYSPYARNPHEGNHAVVVGKSINSFHSLTTLDLDSSHIGSAGAVILSETLATNTTLKQLSIQQNEIGDEGAVAIGQMLRMNCTLTELILDSNEFTTNGQRSLRDAIYDDSSFATLAQSNHTLQSYFFNPRNVFGREVMNDVLSSHAANLRSKHAKQATTKKLKRLLQKKYRINLHFESFLDMETDLLPFVLAFISQKCDLEMMYTLKPILLNLLEGRGYCNKQISNL